MPNLKYPAGLKGKATMGWLSTIILSLFPIGLYYDSYLGMECSNGVSARSSNGEELYFHPWMNTEFNSIKSLEALNMDPNHKSTFYENRANLKHLSDITNRV